MSSYTGSYEKVRRQHDSYLPIGVAVMLISCLLVIFVINPQSGGYGGGTNQLAFWESAGLIWGGVLIGYIALIFRST
jgi:K+-transporting ATPase A subunit